MLMRRSLTLAAATLVTTTLHNGKLVKDLKTRMD